ncbi:polymer-forming cytoskeletal protein [Parvularcula marina]|uniref:bactofilin family protein n=1 Tax=Parvularcula marina TaxID=2292771 RepID=UPI0035159ADD
MFSKAKSNNQQEVIEAQQVMADAEDSTKKNNGRGRGRSSSRPAGVPSIISSDVVIKGSIESAGEVQFDGEIDGDIKAKGLVIGDGARVDGEVMAEKVRVSGSVEGSIRAVEVELASTAFVKGDITHKSLTIESGARFDGSSEHSDDPLSGSGAKLITPRKTVTPPVSAAVEEETTQQDFAEEVVEEEAPRRPVARLEAPRARELMPTRNDPVADRPLLKRPATSTLR